MMTRPMTETETEMTMFELNGRFLSFYQKTLICASHGRQVVHVYLSKYTSSNIRASQCCEENSLC